MLDRGERRTPVGQVLALCWGLTCLQVLAPARWAQAEGSGSAHTAPVVQALLDTAQGLESGPDELEGPWQAAGKYCEAARLGSTEAQYRLGMLHAFGRGVPQSQAMASSLFALAAGQGHAEAQSMLETIQFSSEQLPRCVLEDVVPDKGTDLERAAHAAAGLDKLIAALPKQRRWLLEVIATQARWNGVDPRLALSIIAAESNFQTQAKSAKAAMGLMQLIPETAERFNLKNAYDAAQNVRAGLRYVRWLLSYFQGDVRLVLAAYNAGEGAVDKYKGIPPYKETQAYVKRIMALYGRPFHPFDQRAGKVLPELRRGS